MRRSAESTPAVENSDARPLTIYLSALFFAGLLGLLIAGLWLIYQTKVAQQTSDSLATSTDLMRSDPQSALRELRAEEERKLNGYSWSDADHSRARVPIDRAIEIITKHGLIKSAVKPAERSSEDAL